MRQVAIFGKGGIRGVKSCGPEPRVGLRRAREPDSGEFCSGYRQRESHSL